MTQDKLNLLEKIRIFGQRDQSAHIALSPRLQYLAESYGDLISTSLRRDDNIQISPKEAILKFAGFDPLKNKANTQWLIRTYLKKKLNFHDLVKAQNILAEFYQKRKHLPVEGRDINQYEALSDIIITLRAWETELDSISGREKRRFEQKKAYRESVILEDRHGFKAIAPMTEFASHWWGRGTRWCTASTQSSMFYYYHTNAPLLIFIMPNGDKYQMFVSKTEKSFMDASDKPVSLEFIENNWHLLGGFISWGMTQNASLLSWFPLSLRTQEFCLLALKQNGNALVAFPDEFITREICLQAVSQDGRALKGVPSRYLDKEMYLTAIEENPSSIKEIPEPDRDEEIYWALIKRGGWMLSDVPEEFKTHDLCLHAVSDCGYALQDVPEDQITKEMCRQAVIQDGMALVYVPDKLIDDELCLTALQNGCWALNLIPEALRTREACIACVTENGCMLEHVPENLKDKEICRLAMNNNMGYAFKHIPEHLKDKDFCLEMVEMAGWVLEYIPLELQNYEMCLFAVKSSGLALNFVADKWRTEEVCLQAVMNSALALEYVPENKKTYYMCQLASQKTDQALKYVPNLWKEELSLTTYIHESEWKLDMLDDIRKYAKE